MSSILLISGTPVLKYCRDHRHDRSVLSKLCYHGIRAVCQMIFLDNFVHGTYSRPLLSRCRCSVNMNPQTIMFFQIAGDLHPGNVYISKDGSKFILFDVGIVNEYSTEDHNILIDILSAFIRKDGRKAGRCLIDDSNSKMLMKSAAKEEMARHEEEYIDKIEMLTIKASTEGYFMEHLGTYISYICNAAATHHVMMNPSFVTAALAVKIQEGIALAMDPSCTIPDIAIPIIVESERRRFMKEQKTHWSERFESFKKAFFGVRSDQETK
jgi:aarF domain-containing kinase